MDARELVRQEVSASESQRLSVYYDPDPENPREWANRGVIVCFHRRYPIGDVQGTSPKEELLSVLASVVSTEEYQQILAGPSEDPWDLVFYCKQHCSFIPLYYFGNDEKPLLSMKPFSNPRVAGRLGFIWAPEKNVEAALEEEFNVYKQYLSGVVYCYKVEQKSDGGEWEELDSGSGFYGLDFVEDLKATYFR